MFTFVLSEANIYLKQTKEWKTDSTQRPSYEPAVSKKSVPYEVSSSLWLAEFSHTVAGKSILQLLRTGVMLMINKPTFWGKLLQMEAAVSSGTSVRIYLARRWQNPEEFLKIIGSCFEVLWKCYHKSSENEVPEDNLDSHTFSWWQEHSALMIIPATHKRWMR